jgi:hypothetical protein
MTVFRILLAVLWLTLLAYTAMVISTHGMGLLPIFFGDIGQLTWPGQFNLDFFFLLILSALWTAWRNGFSPAGLGLGLVALLGGAGFLLPYLLYLGVKHSGDMRGVLLGHRA